MMASNMKRHAGQSIESSSHEASTHTNKRKLKFGSNPFLMTVIAISSVLLIMTSSQHQCKVSVEAFSLQRIPLHHPVLVPSSASANNNFYNAAEEVRSKPTVVLSMSSAVIDDEIPSDVNEDNDESPASSSPRSKSSSQSTKSGIGEWEEVHGNYLLRPPQSSPYYQQPRALIHFLGGALVGAAPDISYRYVLERLADKGFLIVATPYTLSFDYISTCDDIIGRFERIAPELAMQLGSVPVVGVGHSCGALLQLLITTLFPDTPRAANALLSYNNKVVKDAVPLFDELVAPFFVSLADRNATSILDGMGVAAGFGKGGKSNAADDASGSNVKTSSLDLLNLGLQLGRTAAEGSLPSDELLTEIARKTTPRPLSNIIQQDVKIPAALRNTVQQAIDPIVKAKEEAGILPLFDQSIDVLEQIPSLIEEVADGARDFNPPPATVRAAARRAYRARRTLLIQYDDDNLDESEIVEEVLREAETVMKMKRPMVGFDVQRTVLKGGHTTPLVAPPSDLAGKAEDLLGEDTAKNALLYSGADATVDELVRWLEEGNL